MLRLLPLFLALLVSTIPATAQTRRLVPIPDAAGYKVLKCDFHLHTVFSDGDVWPTNRVQEAWRDGLDAIAITDHDDYHPHGEDVSKDISRPYAIALPEAKRLGIILIPAAEITKGDIHFNALYTTDPNQFAGLDLTSALTAAKKQGAFLFWNHPGWKGKTEWFPVIEAAHKDGMVHGVELVNGRMYYDKAFPWIAEKNLAIISNTDEHAPMAATNLVGERPANLVFVSKADPEGIREALNARRTVAWMGQRLWGAETLLRGLFEASVKPVHPTVPRQGSNISLLLENRSAMAFEVETTGQPGWISGSGTVAPQSITRLYLRLANAPSGAQEAGITLRVTNALTAPGKPLTVQLPLRISAGE